MNLFFSNPLFWLMAAAAIPLLVHLFARSRPREREFSSLIFLRRAVKRHVRLRRPKDWLLLAVRTLAAACLAAAFLLPYMAGRSMEEQGSRSVILVVDRSASMSAADGQESRISKAGVFAGQIMSDLKRGDLVNLIWADAAPAALFREPMPSHDLVNRELQRIHSRPEAANTAAALALAVEQAARTASTRPTSVYILSDFQSSNWSGVDWEKAFPPDLDVRCIQVADHERLPNTAVTSLKVMPATVLPGQSVTVQAVLSNFGSQPVRVTAHLEAGSLRASRTAEIPAGAKETVSFQAQVPASVEEWPVFVTLDHDAFPADDTAGTVVRVGASLQCDAVTQDEAQLGFMMKALRFIPFLDVQSAGGLGREQPDFIVWNKPEKEDLKKMEALAEAGSVIVAVPDFSGDAVANALMGLPDGPRTFSEYEKTGKGWTLNAALPDDSVFDLFRGGDAASPLDARVFRRLNEGLAPDSWNDLVSVLVRYEDGVPAIARRVKGRGALVLWNVPVQSMDADWGKSPPLPPVPGGSHAEIPPGGGGGSRSGAGQGLSFLDFAGYAGCSGRGSDRAGRSGTSVQGIPPFFRQAPSFFRGSRRSRNLRVERPPCRRNAPAYPGSQLPGGGIQPANAGGGEPACIRGCRHGFRKTGGSNGQNTSVAVAAGGGRSSFRLGTLAFLPACPDGP